MLRCYAFLTNLNEGDKKWIGKQLHETRLIIVVLTGIGGFIVGLSGSSGPSALVAIAVSNILFMSVGFTISGAIVKKERFRHLFKVAICLWIFSLINVFFGFSLMEWVFSFVIILIAMGLGGTFSFIFSRKQNKESETI
jgi:FtsH-binding integral membrane protein